MKEAVNKVGRVTGPGGKPPSVEERKARHISNWLPMKHTVFFRLEKPNECVQC